MPPIGTVGTIVKVTPDDDIEIVRGPGDYEFIDDPNPFWFRVEDTLLEEGLVVSVWGSVTKGHERYLDLIATLTTRVGNSDWSHDNRSAAGFKVGKSRAMPNGEYPIQHPWGTNIEGYPFIIRYGSVDSRAEDETVRNSAMHSVIL